MPGMVRRPCIPSVTTPNLFVTKLDRSVTAFATRGFLSEISVELVCFTTSTLSVAKPVVPAAKRTTAALPKSALRNSPGAARRGFRQVLASSDFGKASTRCLTVWQQGLPAWHPTSCDGVRIVAMSIYDTNKSERLLIINLSAKADIRCQLGCIGQIFTPSW
jgi:hypothetical protein